MARFSRVYRLVVGQSGSSGTEIAPPMQITFEVNKDVKEEANTHKIRVWGLKESTRKAIERPDLVAQLYAGYDDEQGAVLMAAGTVVDAYSYHDGPDWITELAVADGYAELRDTAVSLSYGPGTSSATIIKDIAGQMGLTLNMPDSLDARTWEHGFSYYGPARQALHKVARGAGQEWSVQNQTLQVVATNGTTARSVVVLDASSGLIGYPERTREGAREKAKVKGKTIVSAEQQRNGWRVRSLLLPWINPGDPVQMQSTSVSGLWRVDSVKHSGDYYGEDWTTELNLKERIV